MVRPHTDIILSNDSQFCCILYFKIKPDDVHFGLKYVAGYIDKIYSNMCNCPSTCSLFVCDLTEIYS